MRAVLFFGNVCPIGAHCETSFCGRGSNTARLMKLTGRLNLRIGEELELAIIDLAGDDDRKKSAVARRLLEEATGLKPKKLSREYGKEK